MKVQIDPEGAIIGTGGSTATTTLSIRVIVDLDIESASSTACLSW